jgi:hypothetical protein
MKQHSRTILLASASLLGSGVILAQAPPGPMTPPPSTASTAGPVLPPLPKKPEIAPRKDIFGTWRINKDESDDGRKKLQRQKDAENTNRGNGPTNTGPHIGGPWPGGYPGGGGGRNPHDDSSDFDQMGDIVNPPREIKFIERQPHDPEVELTDDREHRRMFYTDGRKLQKTKGPDYEEISAKWDENKLVTDEKGAHNGKISRTYEVSSDGKQLIETVRVADSKGNHPATVQYVYDAIDEREFNH